MSRCTGDFCPMQTGYDVEHCTLDDCNWRTPVEDKIARWAVEGSRIARKYGVDEAYLCNSLRVAMSWTSGVFKEN